MTEHNVFLAFTELIAIERIRNISKSFRIHQNTLSPFNCLFLLFNNHTKNLTLQTIKKLYLLYQTASLSKLNNQRLHQRMKTLWEEFRMKTTKNHPNQIISFLRSRIWMKLFLCLFQISATTLSAVKIHSTQERSGHFLQQLQGLMFKQQNEI